jgi:uncharacterized membrane protein YedE/YeeE
MGAFVAFRKGIGVSGAYETGAALAARKMAPDALRVNDFVKARDKAPQLDWEVLLVVGTVLGGLLASRSERAVGGAAAEQSPALRSPLASATGGALLMVGARMADGCTSGHSLSGTAQGAASSWVFTPLMFLAGSLLARAARRLRGGL